MRSTLSVVELMQLSCNLKLRETTSKKKQIITNTLTDLKLEHRVSNTVDKLSGGERKRLSVALELVSKPQIFFLDEPTTGLDEISALQCIQMLRSLAVQGRTIVCTIHQPSPSVMENFHHVYMMTRGQCVYQGTPGALVEFLQQNGFECPRTHSPTDYSKFFYGLGTK